MSYYRVNIAIKWANGDLEGFSASALTESAARQRAINKAVTKSKEMRIAGQWIALNGPQYKALSIDQQDSLQADWDSESI